MKYRVIKDIPEGWEGTAKAGDILTLGKWHGDLTLLKDGKAICDVDSQCAKEHCEPIEEAEA
ncbi:hypothetical protein [Paenibacillus macerans]|uniref:hypothetical protein n=1 Tax=Paenibacillus macerans TaxID=44252 RepID=UPI00203F8271|nr:hypothetical protein [Paenibacillus macerans]MCM3703828.1 hypothetical protein [Paenibacillus macerans]